MSTAFVGNAVSTNSDKLSRELDVAAKQLVAVVVVVVGVPSGESVELLLLDVETGVDGVVVLTTVVAD